VTVMVVKYSKLGHSFELFMWWMEYFMTCIKSSGVIHPDNLTKPGAPAGASLVICHWKWTLEKIITRGIIVPMAIMVQHVVTVVLFSALVHCLTCFDAFYVRSFYSLGTVDLVVSF
jgi:hypothetical protein